MFQSKKIVDRRRRQRADFFFRDIADADLHDRRVLERPAHGAGVAVPVAEIAVAQIGVRVDLQHASDPDAARAAAATMGEVIECSPPSVTRNLPVSKIAAADAPNFRDGRHELERRQIQFRHREEAAVVNVDAEFFVPEFDLGRGGEQLARPVLRVPRRRTSCDRTGPAE